MAASVENHTIKIEVIGPKIEPGRCYYAKRVGCAHRERYLVSVQRWCLGRELSACRCCSGVGVKALVIITVFVLAMFSVALLVGAIHITGSVPGILVLPICLGMMFWAVRS